MKNKITLKDTRNISIVPTVTAVLCVSCFIASFLSATISVLYYYITQTTQLSIILAIVSVSLLCITEFMRSIHCCSFESAERIILNERRFILH